MIFGFMMLGLFGIFVIRVMFTPETYLERSRRISREAGPRACSRAMAGKKGYYFDNKTGDIFVLHKKYQRGLIIDPSDNEFQRVKAERDKAFPNYHKD